MSIQMLRLSAVFLVVFGSSACSDNSREDVATQLDEMADRAENVFTDLREDIRVMFDDLEEETTALDERYADAADEVAAGWAVTKNEIREFKDEIDTNLVRMERATEDERHAAQIEIAKGIEEMTARLEHASLEAIEEGSEFVAVTQRKLDEVDRELDSLAVEADEETSQTIAQLRADAEALNRRIHRWSDSTAEGFSEAREEVTEVMASLMGSIRRLEFEVKHHGVAP